MGGVSVDEARAKKRAENQRRWRAGNVERCRELRRVWRRRNPDRYKAQQRRHRMRHAEEMKHYMREYINSHPEYRAKRDATKARYRAAHRDEMNARSRGWYWSRRARLTQEKILAQVTGVCRGEEAARLAVRQGLFRELATARFLYGCKADWVGGRKKHG